MPELDAIACRTGYMKHVYADRRKILHQAGRHLCGVDFDTLVGTGMSGALIIPKLAEAFRCYWAIVRKPGDGSHSCRTVEGSIGRRWVFVDDLIDSGKTYRRVVEAIAEEVDHHNRYSGVEPFVSEHVGSYLYQNYGKPYFEKPREKPKPPAPLVQEPESEILPNLTAPPTNPFKGDLFYTIGRSNLSIDTAYRKLRDQGELLKKPAFRLDDLG
jgi:hypothetical protein